MKNNNKASFLICEAGTSDIKGPYSGPQLKAMWKSGTVTDLYLIANPANTDSEGNHRWAEISNVNWNDPAFGKPKPQWILFTFCVVAVITTFTGRFHVITWSEFNVPRVKMKAVFTFKETFVRIDEITSMPAIAARSRYPLSVRMLQDEGWIKMPK